MKRSFAFFFVLAAIAGHLQAEVLDSNANGFSVRSAVTIERPPAEVFQAIVHDIGRWWSPVHTFSGDPKNLSLDDRATGCLCEKLPDGGSVRHLEVLYVQPNKVLRLAGGLGPLQTAAVTAVLTMQFTRKAMQLPKQQDATEVDWIYTVGGYVPAGLNTWAAPVDFVITEQLGRLQNYMERGDPTLKPGRTAPRQ